MLLLLRPHVAVVVVVTTPVPSLPDLLEGLLRSHEPVARVLSLAADGSVRDAWEADADARLLSGSATLDRSREVRRTASIELANPTGSLSPRTIGDPFFPGERFRVERGLRVGGAPIYLSVATLIVATFAAPMDGRLSVTGEDPMTLLRQPFGEVVTIEAGTTAEDAFRLLVEPVLGDGSGWSLDGAGRTVGATRSWAEDDDRLGAVVSLMGDLGLETFADRLGNPVLRPIPDPTAAATVRTFTRAAGVAAMLDLTRSGSARPFNKAVAIGEGPDRPTYRGVAEVTDPASPVHRDAIGLRVAPYHRSAQIADQATATAVALARLIELALYQDAVGGSAIPDPRLDAGDVVAFIEEVSGTFDRYRLDTVTMPIGPGAMAMAATRVVPLFVEAS